MANNITDYAIVIGIDNYAHLRPLSSSVRDATQFAEWLTSPEGGGLPLENVQVVLSASEATSNRFRVGPVQRDIDNCLSKLVGNGGMRVGRRLYFYFAGYAIGPTADDVVMLMADASPERLHRNIGLRPYRQFFREAGLFDELVFILDCARDAYINVPPVVPEFFVNRNESFQQVKELVIVAAASGRRAFDVASDKGEGRGVLTEAVLKGLQGNAADSQGRITSSGLNAYVSTQLLGMGPDPVKLPDVFQLGPEIVFTANGKGTLIVELPHWTATVEIRSQFNTVPDVGPITMGPKPGIFISETKLPPGIYEVKVTLEGKSAQQIVGVVPNQDNIIQQEAWKELTLTCAAPLAGATSSRTKGYADAAQHWSLNRTWDAGANSGNSSLFVFMSATDPEERAKFASSLFLLDGDGQLIGTFSGDHVQRDDEAGWVAFNANLKPGYYVLRRGRHYRIRQQGVYLCPGWQTQIFLKTKTRRRPSLRLMTLNMARLDRGFEPTDETTIAAEAVLDKLRYGGKSKQLLTSDKMSALLKGKIQNPWLGILAAYVLCPEHGRGESERSRFQKATNRRREDSDSEALFDEVMQFLSYEIPDHPDVRAMRLMRENTGTSFKHPPLLRAGLKLVQSCSTSVQETIPLNSLTDLVLDNLVLNSPWTAWRELETPSSDSPFAEEALIAVTRGRRRSRRAAASMSVSTKALPEFEAADPPFNLMSDYESANIAQSESGLESMPPATISAVTLYEAILIRQALKLAQSGEYSEERYPLDFKKSLNDLLDSITPAEISNLSGMPLSRTTKAWERLRMYGDSPPTLDSDKYDQLLSPETEMVFNYVLQTSDRSRQLPGSEPAPSRSSVTIEDIFLKLRAEANRLKQVDDDVAKYLSDDLGEVTNKLLRHADFILLTRPQNELMLGNAAFTELVFPSDADSASVEAKHNSQQNSRAWESLLAASSTGHSVVESPVPNSISSTWDLQRIAIDDSFKKTTQAYLNILRCPGSHRLEKNSLLALDALMPELTLDASYVAHGTASRRQEYAESLGALIMNIKEIMHTEHRDGDVVHAESAIADDTTPTDSSDLLIDDPELKMPDATLYETEFWGIARHELIAGVAEEKMRSEKAKEAVRRILSPLNGMMLSDVAGWADNVKRRKPDPLKDDPATIEFLKDKRNERNDEWHYVNLPLDAKEYNRVTYPEFTRDDDVVQIMRDCILVLQRQSERFSELNALRMLVHLAGDVHQPAHVGCCYIDTSSTPAILVRDPKLAAAKGLNSDAGGNNLLLPIGSNGVSLHSYWDSRLGGTIKPEDFLDDDEAPAAVPSPRMEGDMPTADPALKRRFISKLSAMIDESPAALNEAAEADFGEPELWPQRWAFESLIVARETYKSLKITAQRQDKFIVAWEGKEAYDKRCKPLVIQQMKLAAQNLAALLDEILG